MKQMAEDHAASQAALIAWTAQCVNDLMNQNSVTEARLQDARTQLKNISYNMQGFDDHVDTAPPIPPLFQIVPPNIVKTATPKIITDPMEVGGGEGTLFPTETGAPPDASLNVNENQRWGGQVSGASTFTKTIVSPSKPHRKSDQQRQEAKMFYLAVQEIKLPKAAKDRWRWAYRKVQRSLRHKTLKIGLTRGKVPLHKTAAERLERIEHEIWALPIALKDYTNKIADQLHSKINQEVAKIEGAMEEAKQETLRITANLQTNIDTVSENLKDVDARLCLLKEQVDNANKQADEVERKLNLVISRVGEHEIAMFDSIKSRVADLIDKVGCLKTLTANTIEKLAKLNQEAEQAQAAADEMVDSAEEGHKLFEMLELDTQLRAARIEINTLDSSTFSVGEILRNLRYELLSASVLAGPERSVEKDVVNEMLAHCDNIVGIIDGIFKSIQNTNELWNGHDQQLAGRWKTLSGIADAVKMVATMSATLEEVKETINAMPTLEVVESMSKSIADEVSQKTVATALIPIDQKIEIVESVVRDLAAEIKDVKVSENAAPAGLPSDIDSQLEPIIQRIVEMYVGGGKTINTNRIKSSGSPNQQLDDTFTALELQLVTPLDGEDPAGNFEKGALVRVIAGEFMNMQGIVTDIIENESLTANPYEMEEGESDDANIVQTGDGAANDVGVNKGVKFRVSLAPSSPLRTPFVASNYFDGLEPPMSDIMDERYRELPPLAPESKQGDALHFEEEIKKLSQKIEDLISGKVLPPNMPNQNVQRSSSRSTTGVEVGVTEAIKDAIQDVLVQMGYLKESQEKELTKAKQQMKEAIIKAITKAIIDKDKEDKESFLTTKSMCIGCGRSSFVRKEDNSQPAVSLGFIPGLNAGSTAGPDVYRSGFKLPVHVQNRSSSPTSPVGLPAGFTDDIFEDDNDLDSGKHPNTISTYSEILAGITGVTSITDAGPAGTALSISPCISPIKLSSAAKSIRHAQGRDESVMLRPIHRKNFPGKTSARARQAYAPERFDLPADLHVGSKSLPTLNTKPLL